MSEPVGIDKCLSFISAQIKPAPRARPEGSRLSVTISRQTGSGGHSIAERLAAHLAGRGGVGERPWTVFDRDLVKLALREHNLDERLADTLAEDRVSELEDIIRELLGAQSSSWNIVPQVTDTILKVADLGNAIIVGRGCSVITSRLPHVFHVRLVGSIERRIERVMASEKLSRKAAADFIVKSDRGRKRYLRKYFQANIDDPLLYHLILNTDRFDFDAAARVIGDAALAFLSHLRTR